MTTILAIESSCDETACAVVRDGREILSNIISSQIDIHELYGGVVPEIASRNHLDRIEQVVNKALKTADLTWASVDALAVTAGPGLVGALLVGVSYAKGLAYSLNKPLIPVHHIEGHIAANYIEHPALQPPFMSLVISGGHSHLIHVRDYTDFEIIGKTADDACGEAFDKVARVIGLGYPGGPKLEKLAKDGDEEAIRFPRPKVAGEPYGYSFSGIKSAVLNYLNRAAMRGETVRPADVAAGFQKAVADVLTERAVAATLDYGMRDLAVAGGVAANNYISNKLSTACATAGIRFYRPAPIYCTDNAAMIGVAGYYGYQAGRVAGLDLNAVAHIDVGRLNG
ncbi:MAG: tRNA (adenosine(37)-N6)-threonylcarbamoyltransferase complex transferase subunit TsaD [Eubacteriales bacterium]|nr:tRNA (adenosine(37)-N6)-threonylcarbamoyltransferase complex transferase subunit TsaD [Eubacteriales bacterium]